jgi:MFS family permease
VKREWLDGLHLVKRERLISTLFVVMGTAAFAQGIINVLFVIFVKEVLRGSAPVFGWLVAIQGVGGLIGGFIIGHVDRIVPPTRLITLSEVAVGVIFLTMYSVPVLPLALALSALLAVPATGYQVSTQTLLQAGVSDHYRGRIVGSSGMIQSLFLLGGMGLASALGDFLGVVPLLDAAGGLFCCAGMVALALPHWPMPGTVGTLHRPSARCVTLAEERIDRA